MVGVINRHDVEPIKVSQLFQEKFLALIVWYNNSKSGRIILLFFRSCFFFCLFVCLFFQDKYWYLPVFQSDYTISQPQGHCMGSKRLQLQSKRKREACVGEVNQATER